MPANPTSGNPATDGCVTCEMDHRRVLIDKLRTENTRLAAENERLLARQQELLATIVRVTNETPYPEEIQGWQSQRSAMIAEVGSLKAEVIGLKRALLASERERDQYMAAVVENGTRADSLAAKLGECEKERDALRSHYDRAAPEHNLLALLDLYAERESAACAECERMRADAGGLRSRARMADGRPR